jgi:hypothetical protein
MHSLGSEFNHENWRGQARRFRINENPKGMSATAMDRIRLTPGLALSTAPGFLSTNAKFSSTLSIGIQISCYPAKMAGFLAGLQFRPNRARLSRQNSGKFGGI